MSNIPGLLAVKFFEGLSEGEVREWFASLGITVESLFLSNGSYRAVVRVPAEKELAYKRLIAASLFVEDVHQETQQGLDQSVFQRRMKWEPRSLLP